MQDNGDEVLYYDNMELFGDYFRSKSHDESSVVEPEKRSVGPIIAGNTNSRAPKKTQIVEPAAHEEKPPALPPKKKNRSNRQNAPDSHPNVDFVAKSPPVSIATSALSRVSINKPPEKITQGKLAKAADAGHLKQDTRHVIDAKTITAEREIPNQARPAPIQHPIPGIHTLVDAPLAPILEEESHVGSPSSISARLSQLSYDSDSSSSTKSLLSSESSATTEKEGSEKVISTDISSLGSKDDCSMIGNLSDTTEISQEDDVTPYGMVDLSALDQTSEDGRGSVSSLDLHYPQRRPSNANATSHSSLHANDGTRFSERSGYKAQISKDKAKEIGSGGKGKHSTAVSTLDRHGNSFSPRHAASSRTESNVRTNHGTRYPRNNHEPSSGHPKGQLYEELKPSTKGERPLPPKPHFAVFSTNSSSHSSQPATALTKHRRENYSLNLPQNENRDVNHYHEIEVAKASKKQQISAASTKHTDDFQDILDILNLPADYYESHSKDISQFPTPGGDDGAQYDNFSSRIAAESKAGRNNISSTLTEIRSPGEKPLPTTRSLSVDVSSPPFSSGSSSIGKNLNGVDTYSRQFSAPYSISAQYDTETLQSKESPVQRLSTNHTLSPNERHVRKDSSSDFTAEVSRNAGVHAAQPKKTLDEHNSGSVQTNKSVPETASESQDDSMQQVSPGKGKSPQKGHKTSDDNSDKQLANSTQSLNRKTRERKKSPLRAKFKFRSRSKSRDRVPYDSGSEFDFDSKSTGDVEQERRPGSRLGRRVSRKLSQRRGRSLERKSAGEETPERQRNHNPVSFIRKLLRKSHTMEEEFNYEDYNAPSKTGDSFNSPENAEARHVPEKVDASTLPKEQQRSKVMSSPPSRRARKLLHNKPAKMSHNAATRIRREEDKFWSSSSSSDMDSVHQNSHNKRGERNFGSARLYPGQEPVKSLRAEAGIRRQNEKEASMLHSRGRGDPGMPSREDGAAMARESQSYHNKQQQHRQKYKTLVSLNAQTLKKVTEKWLSEWRNRLPVGGFLITSWSDITLISKQPQCVLGPSVIYMVQISANPEHKLACQIFNQQHVNPRLLRRLENSSMLTAHPNLCNICSHFFCRVPATLLDPSRGDAAVDALCIVLANRPAMSLRFYVENIRKQTVPKQRHKQILILALQLLQILREMSSSGFNLPCITKDHIIVSQENTLLQVLPHMECNEHHEHRSNSPPQLVQNVASIIIWMVSGDEQLRTALDAQSTSRLRSNLSPYSKYSFSLLRIISHFCKNGSTISVGTAMELVQCALWGPSDTNELTLGDFCQLEDLEMWVDMQQAKLVNNLAVLLTAKYDVLPIDMFYKHQYFSQVNPDNLMESLRILQRVDF